MSELSSIRVHAPYMHLQTFSSHAFPVEPVATLVSLSLLSLWMTSVFSEPHQIPGNRGNFPGKRKSLFHFVMPLLQASAPPSGRVGRSNAGVHRLLSCTFTSLSLLFPQGVTSPLERQGLCLHCLPSFSVPSFSEQHAGAALPQPGHTDGVSHCC